MIYKRNNRKISHQLRINIMVPVVVFGRYNFPGQLLQPKLAFITPCPPSYPPVDRFYCLLALPGQSQSPTLSSLDSHSPWQTPQRSRMDFVQHFLSLKPEEIFKTVNRDPPTTFLIMLIAICIIVLTMMVIFIFGLCNLCKTTPSIKESDESVTLVETPV